MAYAVYFNLVSDNFVLLGSNNKGYYLENCNGKRFTTSYNAIKDMQEKWIKIGDL